jgi:hypothetical protein
MSQETLAEMIGTTRSRGIFSRTGSGRWVSSTITAVMVCSFTVRCSTSCFTTRTPIRNPSRYSLADIATLGFAISFMTSASVALADGFFTFFFLMPS